MGRGRDMRRHERFRRGAVVALLAATVLAGCGRGSYAPPAPRPGDGAYDIVTIASFDAVGPGTFHFESLPASAHKRAPFVWPWQPHPHPYPLAAASIFHPSLRSLVGTFTGNPTDSLTLLISLVDRVRLPRFPEPFVTRPKNDSLNLAVQAQTRTLIHGVVEARRPQYTADSTFLSAHGGRIIERFWITRAILARLVRDSLGALARDREITYVQPPLGLEAPDIACPPVGDDPRDDVIEAIRLLHTEPYRQLQLDYGWVGLLDSGVDDKHPLFGSAVFAGKSDCVKAIDAECEECCSCTDGTALDESETGHGTSSAAILSAAGMDCDGRFRGVTEAQLTVYKVFDGRWLSLPAALRAIQCIAAWGDRIIVFETQDCSRDAAALAVAADNLYDSGAIVVAAVGNLQRAASNDVANCDSRIGNPAAARRVIAVGAREIVGQSTPAYQSRGMLPDNRIKPDLQAPTSTQTAALTEDGTQVFGEFSGTSGATPYAAAVATLLRNWMMSHGRPFDPGQVYALMILCGQILGPYAADSETGAGLITMPTNAVCHYSKTALNQDYKTTDVPIDVQTPGDKRIEAAIWWPETLKIDPDSGREVFNHDEVDLEILDPNGNVVASSAGPNSVFQRTTAASLTSGRWIVRITAKTLLQSPQTVYYAVAVRHS